MLKLSECLEYHTGHEIFPALNAHRSNLNFVNYFIHKKSQITLHKLLTSAVLIPRYLKENEPRLYVCVIDLRVYVYVCKYACM